MALRLDRIRAWMITHLKKRDIQGAVIVDVRCPLCGSMAELDEEKGGACMQGHPLAFVDGKAVEAVELIKVSGFWEKRVRVPVSDKQAIEDWKTKGYL
ncbi:MAG: hypothetical protein ACE5JP_05930 [Candidatus Bipolaricaulia bacterium]